MTESSYSPNTPASLILRLARHIEMDSVYEMGFDVWNDGQQLNDYFAQCNQSVKYKSGRWFVLSYPNDELVCSALVHDFRQIEHLPLMGIGSVATPKKLRCLGFGSMMITILTEHLLTVEGAKVVFLYSDIGEHFYAKLGYKTLPASLQKHQGNYICMASCAPGLDITILNEHISWVPKYF